MIPYSRQRVDDDDVAAVVEVMRSDWLTTGPAVESFEAALAARVQARHAIAVNSGTAALHLALLASGIGRGDRVATSTISFSASANCARYVGADVDLLDIDPNTLNLDISTVEHPDALIAVHFTGLPVDMAAITDRPRVVIEDAAQALGASSPDGPVGNCAHSDMTTFSFHPVKSITTGEGGAITTNDDTLAARVRSLRSHGITRHGDHEPWEYDIAEIGFNYRLPDMSAALGRSQLEKLDSFVSERAAQAQRYRELLADAEEIVLPPSAPPGFRHAHHLFVVRVPDRRRVYDHLRDRGIGAQVHHVPIHRLDAYRAAVEERPFRHADDYYAEALSLPLYPGLDEESQAYVVDTLLSTVG